MMLGNFRRPAVLGALLLATGSAGHAQTERTSLTALRSVEPGQWLLRERGRPDEKLCVTDPTTLLQLRHGHVACSQMTVENGPSRATIQYTCPGHGHGRTTIAVETPRLIRVETQGVRDGLPFAVELEGRKTGSCGQAGL